MNPDFEGSILKLFCGPLWQKRCRCCVGVQITTLRPIQSRRR